MASIADTGKLFGGSFCGWHLKDLVVAFVAGTVKVFGGEPAEVAKEFSFILVSITEFFLVPKPPKDLRPVI